MATSKHDIVPPAGIRSFRERLAHPVRFLGFWTAVVSPFLLLGLVVTGLATRYPLVLTGLLAANIAGIVLGNRYGR